MSNSASGSDPAFVSQIDFVAGSAVPDPLQLLLPHQRPLRRSEWWLVAWGSVAALRSHGCLRELLVFCQISL